MFMLQIILVVYYCSMFKHSGYQVYRAWNTVENKLPLR